MDPNKSEDSAAQHPAAEAEANSNRWIRIPWGTDEKKAFLFFAPVVPNSTTTTRFGFFKSRPGWQLDPEEIEFDDQQLIRFFVAVLGSGHLSSLLPTRWSPIQLVKGHFDQIGDVAKQMREEVRTHYQSAQIWESSQTQHLTLPQVQIEIDGTILTRQLNGSWKFSQREMQLETMASFAQIALRDEWANQTMEKYHFDFLPGPRLFRCADTTEDRFVQCCDDVTLAGSDLTSKELLPRFLAGLQVEFTRYSGELPDDASFVRELLPLVELEWGKLDEPICIDTTSGDSTDEASRVRLCKLLYRIEQLASTIDEAELLSDTRSLVAQIPLALQSLGATNEADFYVRILVTPDDSPSAGAVAPTGEESKITEESSLPLHAADNASATQCVREVQIAALETALAKVVAEVERISRELKELKQL